MIGSRFGRLVVISSAPGKHGKRRWVSACDCGGQTTSYESGLLSGRSRSCGCLRLELPIARNRIGPILAAHNRSRTSEYAIWAGMKQRCLNPNNSRWSAYGGRGITICDQWVDSFETFLADVGPRPSMAHTLDRIDNDGPYAPGNVRWSSASEQQLNTRRPERMIEIDGETRSIKEWASKAGIGKTAILYRLSRGYSGRDLIQPRLKASPGESRRRS